MKILNIINKNDKKHKTKSLTKIKIENIQIKTNNKMYNSLSVIL